MSASGILCLGHHWGDATSRYTMSSLREHNIQVYCHPWGNTTSRYTMSSLREHSSTHVVRIVRKSDICECQPVWWENNTRVSAVNSLVESSWTMQTWSAARNCLGVMMGRPVYYVIIEGTQLYACMSVCVCMCKNITLDYQIHIRFW